MDNGLFCVTRDHFLTRRQTLCPCVFRNPNELSPREPTLQQTHFWVRTHQPREQISGNYCIRLMLLSSEKYFIPCWVSQTLRIISLCCAADKDLQASGMLLTLYHPNSFGFSQYSASISSWRSHWFIPNSPTQNHIRAGSSSVFLGEIKQDLFGFLILLFPYSNCFWYK